MQLDPHPLANWALTILGSLMLGALAFFLRDLHNRFSKIEEKQYMLDRDIAGLKVEGSHVTRKLDTLEKSINEWIKEQREQFNGLREEIIEIIRMRSENHS